MNPAGRTTGEQERTREVAIRRIRKNVLVRELKASHQPSNPRGSWIARHAPEEIVMKRKTRKPFKMRTRNGSIIDVTPTHPKRIPMLKKNVSERTVIELYAEPPAARSGEKRGSDEVNGHL